MVTFKNSIMESENTSTKKQKADLDLKITLPNVEKPFYDKMSTERNMLNQLKKAGSKLGENESINVSINSKTISLSKIETQSTTLSNDVMTKLNSKQEEKENISEKQNAPVENNNSEKTIHPIDKNISFLKDQIKYLGFGEEKDFLKKLEEKIKKKKKSFSISTSSDKTSFQNKIDFKLHFNKSEETNNVFFNKFDATLTNEKRNLNLQHTFAVKNNGFTAKQSINLLEGRAVKTELTNPTSQEKETAFVKFKLNEEKNEKGNFKLQVYNKNYGINTANIVDKSNLVFKDEKHKEITIKSLEKGNIVAVKMKDRNKEIEGKAVLNPQYKMLNLYDNNMKRLNTNDAVIEESTNKSEHVKKQQHQSR
mgnify:CR=1 FL=1